MTAVSSRLRSRVSNRRSLFVEGVDHRSAEARRFRDLLDDYLADLGGPESTSGCRTLRGLLQDWPCAERRSKRR